MDKKRERKLTDNARGYMASGSFRGNRVPQHIQNQVINMYCKQHSLRYLLARAEYSFANESFSQLNAALLENINHIVFYSIWQLPKQKCKRLEIYSKAVEHKIDLHFACESEIISSARNIEEIENLIEIYDSLGGEDYYNYLKTLTKAMRNS